MRARSWAAAILICAPVTALAQGPQVPFGGLKHDPTEQV